MASVVCGALVASALILKLMSAEAATVSVHLPVVGGKSWAVVLMAALVFGNGFAIGSLLRSGWAFIYSPGITGFFSLLAISNPGRSATRESTIELIMIELLISGTVGVLVGIIAGRLILGRYRRPGCRPDFGHGRPRSRHPL